jgi:hypothetical protein
MPNVVVIKKITESSGIVNKLTMPVSLDMID